MRSPYGIRTRAIALKEQRPWPLDEGALLSSEKCSHSEHLPSDLPNYQSGDSLQGARTLLLLTDCFNW